VPRRARGVVTGLRAAEQPRDGLVIALGIANVTAFTLGVTFYVLDEERAHGEPFGLRA
jgi:hypothetical protein